MATSYYRALGVGGGECEWRVGDPAETTVSCAINRQQYLPCSSAVPVKMEMDKQPRHLQCLRQAWSHRRCPRPSPAHPAALTAVIAVNGTVRLRFSHDYLQAKDITISESPLLPVLVTSLPSLRPQLCWLRKLPSKSGAIFSFFVLLLP